MSPAMRPTEEELEAAADRLLTGTDSYWSDQALADAAMIVADWRRLREEAKAREGR